MKALKYLIVPIVVASVVFVACQKEEEGGEGGGPTGRARWTIIGYLDGNNNLDISQNNTSYVIADAQDMEAVGSTNNVQIIVALGSLKTGGVVKYYHIEHFENELPDSLSSPVLRNLGSKDMSDPATLTEFIQYAVQHYPADHYLLLIDDHGGGWRGCCVDEQNGAGDLMSMPELRQAIEEANVHFDIILFHACLMGQVEVAYELKDVADYVVASEFTMPMLSVLGAQEWLGALVDTPNMSARDLASRIVEAVYNSGQHQQKDVHMAAIDLSKMDALASKLSTFANRLLDSGGDHWDEIIHAWGQTHYTQYDDPAFVDLREYVKNVKLEPNLGQIPVIRDAADELIDAINDAVVITMTNVPGLTRGGMTIHFPYEEAQYDSANYARLRFRATNWIGFLRQFLDHVGGGGGGNQVTISGVLNAYGGETQYQAGAIFSHDQIVSGDDIEIQGDIVAPGNFTVTFDIPAGYGTGDFVVFYFMGTHCMDIDNDGNVDDLWVGFYPEPDQQGNLQFVPLQSNYTNVTVEAYYYLRDGCGKLDSILEGLLNSDLLKKEK